MKRKLLNLLALLPFLLVKSQSTISFTTQITNTTKALFGISFADTAKGFACGADGTVLKTTNGGTTWTNISPAFTGIFWDVKVLPGTNGQSVMVAGDSAKVLLSTNAGVTWTNVSVPLQAGSYVFGIQFLSATTWVLASAEAGLFQGAVLMSTNSGLTWSKVSFTNSAFIEKTWLSDTANGYIVGNNSSFIDGACYKKTSSNYSLSKSAANLLTNLWVFNPNKVITVGLGGEIWKTTDGGVNWNSKSYNNLDLYDIHFADTLNGFACGGVSSNIILRTINGGETWTPVNFATNGYLQSIDIVNKHVYMAGVGGSIIKTILKPAVPPNPVGLKENSEAIGFEVFPNPVSNYLEVKCKTNTELSLSLYDMQGKEVLSTTVLQDRKINLFEFPVGLYQLVISDASGVLHTTRICKE